MENQHRSWVLSNRDHRHQKTKPKWRTNQYCFVIQEEFFAILSSNHWKLSSFLQSSSYRYWIFHLDIKSYMPLSMSSIRHSYNLPNFHSLTHKDLELSQHPKMIWFLHPSSLWDNFVLCFHRQNNMSKWNSQSGICSLQAASPNLVSILRLSSQLL